MQCIQLHSHSWLLKALKLAKVTGMLFNAIKNLTKTWCTILTPSSETEILTTELIKFLQSIFQGDRLSVMLFMLCPNPLSFLLTKCKGYSFGKTRKLQHTHNFFVDVLKTLLARFKPYEETIIYHNNIFTRH